MTAKHSPATSLPFKHRENTFITARGHVFACPTYAHPTTPDDGLSESDVRQNFSYLVHAANAYPKLVEALRETLRDRLTQANLHQLPPGIRSRLESARALLRELGEAE